MWFCLLRKSNLVATVFFPLDDKFFEDGNILCRLVQEKYLPHVSVTGDEGESDMEIDKYSISCQMHGCFQQFLTLPR